MKSLVALMAAGWLVATLAAQQAPGSQGEPLALVHANLVNVRDGRIASGVTVVLRNGRIESIGTGAAPAGVKALDLKGKYLLPGLIDAHTHAADFPSFRRALESGVTTMRSAGVSNYADVGFHQLVKGGAMVGPDIVTAGYHVRPQMAPEAFLGDPSYIDLLSGVTTIEKMRRAVQLNLSHGVDWIKILATERAGTADTDPRKQVYTEDEIRAIVQEAATKNAPVEAHAHGDEGAMAAVKAGVRSIEHGTYLSDATLEAMKARGTYLDPTYTTVIDLTDAGGDYDVPALRIRGEHMLPRLRDVIGRAHKMGVKIVAGTDTGYGPNSLTRVSQEVAHFVEMGLTPLEAVQSATITSAEMLRLEKSVGSAEVGFEADLIAVEHNPLEQIVTLQDPLLVISNGRVGLDRLDFGRAR
ncbi:MAG TPA: amidohydrolase family protein [Vicinamibacterales bacterium]|nr:amidohydrolase family protein [Vicinamibacterales bacterium]